MEGFNINIDLDRMSVKLIAGDNLINPITSEVELFDYFRKHDIISGIRQNEIIKAFTDLPKLTEPRSYLIVQGLYPENGKDSEIIFNTDVSGQISYQTNEEDIDSIDYKDSMIIPIVSPGDCICTITEPTDGIDGYNIEGKVLIAKDGKFLSISVGDGAEFSFDGSEIYATAEGRPFFHDHKVSVSAIYEVFGDVCYESGNINFDGHVYVSGSVEDDFSITSDSLEIRGLVGSSVIKTEGDLIIRGGVNGRHSGTIYCKGNASIKYLNDANIEIDGDLHVINTIVNSRVKCNGRVTCNHILGGTTTALKGVEVNTLGSEFGTPTHIETGINFCVLNYDIALSNLSKQIENTIFPVKKYLGDHDYYQKLTNNVKRRVHRCFDKFNRLKTGYMELVNTKSAASRDEEFNPVNEVIILKKLYSDVTISTSICRKQFRFNFDGPIKIVENLNFKTMSIIKYSFEEANSKYNKTSPDAQYLFRPASINNNVKESPSKIRLSTIKKTIFSKDGIYQLERDFKIMLYGQGFSVCVFDERHSRRMMYFNYLKKAGINNILLTSNCFEVLETIKEKENEKIIFICRISGDPKHNMKVVASFLCDSSNHFAILVAKKANRKLLEAAKRIPSLKVIDEDTSAHTLVSIIRQFGFSF